MALELNIVVKNKKAAKDIEAFARKSGAEIKRLEKQSVTASKKIKSSFSVVNKTLGALGLAGGLFGLISGIKSSVRLAGIQEKAYARLDANLRNVLTSFEGFEDGTSELNRELERRNRLLIEQAKALQTVTTFGDEAIISAQAMLSTFALNADELKKLTPAILDMAAASEKATGTQADLEQIAIAVGKALTIGVGSLTRYGVVISDAAREQFKFADQAQKVDIILGELNKNFAGVAETVGKTKVGQLERIGKRIGDIGEALGGIFLNKALLNGLESVINGLANFIAPETVLQTNTMSLSMSAIADSMKLVADDAERAKKAIEESAKEAEKRGLIEQVEDPFGFQNIKESSENTLPPIKSIMSDISELIEKGVESGLDFNTAFVDALSTVTALATKMVQVHNEIEQQNSGLNENNIIHTNVLSSLQSQAATLSSINGLIINNNDPLQNWLDKQEQIKQESLLTANILGRWTQQAMQTVPVLNLVNEELNDATEETFKLADASLLVEGIIGGIGSGLATAVIQGEKLTKIFDRLIEQLASRFLSGLLLGGISALIPGLGFAGFAGGFRAGFGFADGGTVPFTGRFRVGERGPEEVVLPKGSQVIPNNQITNNTPINITIKTQNIDERFVKFKLAPILRKIQRQGFSIA